MPFFWYDAVLWSIRSSHPIPLLNNLTIFGKWRQISIWSLFLFVELLTNHSNLQEHSARLEQIDYPSVYRPSLSLRRETRCLLVSFSYHLSSLAFAFCLILQSQWHKCSFQRVSSPKLGYWKHCQSKQCKKIFPRVLSTTGQPLHLSLG